MLDRSSVDALIRDCEALKAALRESTEARAIAAQNALDAQIHERHRIARELHDDIAQQLALLQIGIDRVRLTMPAGPEFAEALDQLSNQTAEVITAIREVVYDLHARARPARMVRVLGDLCRTLGEQLELTVTFNRLMSGVTAKMPGDIVECVSRVVQEALVNVAKHSGAKRAWVTVWMEAGMVCFSIRDDGDGLRARRGRKGIGLKTMAERVKAVNGQLWILSNPGGAAGTIIAGQIPVGAVADPKPHP